MSFIKWVRQTQERGGSYMFAGELYISSGVQAMLTEKEINWIVTDVKEFVKLESGIDYLVVYKHQETLQKLFFIDQLNTDMIASGQFKPDDNRATLILASEY